MVAFSFQQSFYQLVLVCAHCNLCNVNVAIAHSHHTQVFFLNSLTGSSELSNCTSRSSFGSLTACVGVNFCIEYQNVYIFAGSQYVVQTAVTDIVSPAVTTEDPLRFFNQLIFVFQYVGNDVLSFCICASIAFQCSYQSVGCFSGFFTIEHCFNPSINNTCNGSVDCFQVFQFFFQTVSHLFNSGSHTQTIFCVVFEQGVSPSGTTAIFICCVRHRRCGTTPDGGAACCVCNVHSITKQLCYQFCVRCFATACACAGEFQQRLFELRTFHGTFAHRVSFRSNFVDCVIPVSNFSFLCSQRFHNQSFVRSRAYYCTATAAQAVQSGNLHSVFQTSKCSAAFSVYCFECSRSFCSFFFCQQYGTD